MKKFTSTRKVAYALTVLSTALMLPTSGCMYSPYNDQIYASKYSAVAFNGFVKAPNALVEIYVQSWPKGDCAVVGTETEWELLLTTYSNDTPTVDWEGTEWYLFHATKVVPSANWCSVPAGPGGTPGGTSYKTHVTARYKHGNSWINLGTVEKNFMSCAQQQNGDGWAMYNNCRRTGAGSHAVAIWAKP